MGSPAGRVPDGNIWEASLAISIDVADELLTTTRAVRKRLDLSRPVPRQVILDCIRVSQQAPTGSNNQGWRWIVITDPEKRAALAELYRSLARNTFPALSEQAKVSGEAQTVRVYDSATYLADHLHEVPALVVPCLLGRPADMVVSQASFYASIYPAVWSFSLALRARGLGTALTTFHLAREKEAASILGIPDDVSQAALIPVAYTIGETFKPALRPPVEDIVFFDSWGARAE
jgi:nitroreductase